MDKQQIILTGNIESELEKFLSGCAFDKLFVLTDENTSKVSLPLISKTVSAKKAVTITIPANDGSKNLDTLAVVWSELSQKGASRHSLLINLGGGMVTDLGGFAASTFKRGIPYINIPTTLLSMVDAAVGGKTGINFNGLKNEIGVFAPAMAVFIDMAFLHTLDQPNLFSGYAEMLKHGLISTESHWNELISLDMEEIDFNKLGKLVGESVHVKEDVVEKDPYEKNIRKSLNLGHTVGHAFESLALSQGQPVLHGYAVAWGVICELYLSHVLTGFPLEKMRQADQYIKNIYGSFYFDCEVYDRLYELMTHDKKNQSGTINFTLLGDIGDIRIDQTASKELIFEMFDFYRECMGI